MLTYKEACRLTFFLRRKMRTRRVRLQAQRYLPRCVYCLERGGTKEHLIPRSLGGRLTVPACKRCNAERGTRPPSKYKPLLLYIQTEEGLKKWTEALLTSRDPVKVEEWLNKSYY